MREDIEGIKNTQNQEERLAALHRLARSAVNKRLTAGLKPWRGTEVDAAQPLDRDLETALLDIFREFQEGSLKSTVAFILGEVGSAASIPALAEFLRTAKDEDQLLVAVDALGKIGGPEVVAILKQQVEANPNELVRGFAIQALHQLHDNAFARRALSSCYLEAGRANIAEFVQSIAQKDPSLYVREMAHG